MGSDSGAQRPSIQATVREDSRPPTVGAPSGFAEGAQVAGRFVVNRGLGRGSSGEVLAVQDLSLDREVAMKVLRGAGGPAIARFMREARITARLDHPNIPPVHALEFLPDGGLLFTMRKLEGMTLGDAIRRAAVDETPPAIASVNGVVNLGLRVCEALSRAHFLGVVHCDVKPDNIMLGQHGEVALVDWGECRLVDEPPVQGNSTVGTPAYMSPEQARGESPDRRSDIYALGATLFHALTGRLPIFDEEPERFWEKKRHGEIDALPAAIQARIPRPLLAIVLRALAPIPTARYATAADLATDLERFQAGQAVVAYRESLFERSLRWLRRHRRDVAAAAAILLVCLSAGALLWREHLRRLADWGPPLVVEAYNDASWRTRWTPIEAGRWEVVDGALETVGEAANRLLFNRVLAGSVAIEYEAEIPSGALPGDLSVLWTEDVEVLNPQTGGSKVISLKARGYQLQAGGYDNYLCRIAREPGGGSMDQNFFRLVPGTRHQFRVELDGTSLSMWIDGKLILHGDETLPIGSGRIGLYGHYPKKRFSNVRIYQKRLPQLVSVLAIGDAHMHRSEFAAAANAYHQAQESHPGTELALEARFRRGLAERLAGNTAAMRLLWDDFPAGETADRISAYRIEDMIGSGEDQVAADLIVALWERRPNLRSQLRMTLCQWMRAIETSSLDVKALARAELVLDLKLRRLPPDPGSQKACAGLLLGLGRLEDLVRYTPEEIITCSTALVRLGRGDEALSRFPDSSFARFRILREQGRIDELLVSPVLAEWMRSVVLCSVGRSEEVLRYDATSGMALRRLGRFDEALASARQGEDKAIALAALGRWDEALHEQTSQLPALQRLADRIDPRAGGEAGALHFIGWRLAGLDRAEDRALREALRARLHAAWPDWDKWIDYAIVDPLITDDPGLLRRRMEELWSGPKRVASQRPWHLAGFVLGHLDEAGLRAQPFAAEGDMWTVVGRALRHTLAGERDQAQAAWRAYLALPWEHRIIGSLLPDVALESLAKRYSVTLP